MNNAQAKILEKYAQIFVEMSKECGQGKGRGLREAAAVIRSDLATHKINKLIRNFNFDNVADKR